MASYCKLICLGNLTRDVDLRFLPSGDPVGQFGFAINRSYKSKQGEKLDEVTFLDCTVFGKTAENLAKFVRKGSPLLFEGRLRMETWDDKKTGEKRSKLSVICENFQLIGSKSDAEGDAPSAPRAAKTETVAPAATTAPTAPEDDGTVPF